MAVKTVTITEEAYSRLSSMKAGGESFSETILRLGGKRKLSEFVGILSEESADEIEKSIKEMRKRHYQVHRKRMKRIIQEMKGN